MILELILHGATPIPIATTSRVPSTTTTTTERYQYSCKREIRASTRWAKIPVAGVKVLALELPTPPLDTSRATCNTNHVTPDHTFAYLSKQSALHSQRILWFGEISGLSLHELSNRLFSNAHYRQIITVLPALPALPSNHPALPSNQPHQP
jgi:hypothetical protein